MNIAVPIPLFPTVTFDVEHIVPIFADGTTISENLALSCHGCNLHKSSKVEGFDTISEKTVRLFHPRNDEWNEHFIWANEFSVIVGLTPIGRATVETLQLNRKGLINQRKMLRLYGEHLPNN